MKDQLQYKKAIADYLGLSPAQVSLFWKGRVGLYGILQAVGVGPGDEVIIPAFTCVVVPNAIKYLGARPIYAEIDPHTYNMAVDRLAEKITPQTKVILAQNTFGLSSDFDGIQAIANTHGIRVIEDCTHGFGGTYKNQPNGTLASAAFYSTQWNKPFSTGLGGIVVCRDLALAEQLSQFEAKLATPNFKTAQMLSLQRFVRANLLAPALYWSALKLYRFLSKHNLITGSSQGAELAAPIMPPDYLWGMSAAQARAGIQALQSFAENLAHRQQIAAIYHEGLAEIGISPPSVPAYANHTFIKYPILVKDRPTFLRQAEKEKIQLGDWFLSPIHPIEKNFERWDYPYGAFPIAEKISQHMLNLSTDKSISPQEAKRIVKFLHRKQAALCKPNTML